MKGCYSFERKVRAALCMVDRTEGAESRACLFTVATTNYIYSPKLPTGEITSKRLSEQSWYRNIISLTNRQLRRLMANNYWKFYYVCG